MTTETVHIGDSKTLRFNFTDTDGAAADPTSIALTIREPDGTEIDKTEADMTSSATGQWDYDFAVTKAGRHYAFADGDGAIEAAVGIEFYALARNAGA